MCPKKHWLLRSVVPAIAILGAAIGWSSPSEAYVQEFVIDSTNTANYSPIPLGSSTPGASVSYTIYTGRIFGALNPSLPQNAVITDIGLASPVYTSPAPPSGDATYISQFSIVTPTNPAQRSGLLIYEVSNSWQQRDQHRRTDSGCDLCPEQLAGRPSGPMLRCPWLAACDAISLRQSELYLWQSNRLVSVLHSSFWVD